MAEGARMSLLKEKPRGSSVSATTSKLLTELGEECQPILKPLRQLETPGLKAEQVEALPGEPSAAVLHLYEHTRGLDAVIDEDLSRG